MWQDAPERDELRIGPVTTKVQRPEDFCRFGVIQGPRFPSWIPMQIGMGSNPIARYLQS
jgi:hypothetical protein